MGFNVSTKESGNGISFVSVTFNGETDIQKAEIMESIRRDGGNLLSVWRTGGAVLGLSGYVYDHPYADRSGWMEGVDGLVHRLESFGGQLVQPEYPDQSRNPL